MHWVHRWAEKWAGDALDSSQCLWYSTLALKELGKEEACSDLINCSSFYWVFPLHFYHFIMSWVVAFTIKATYAIVHFNFIFFFATLWHRQWTYVGMLMFRAAEHTSQQLSKRPFIFNCSPQWRPIKDEDRRVRITLKPFEGHRLSICFAGRLPITHFICVRMQTLGQTHSVESSTIQFYYN